MWGTSEVAQEILTSEEYLPYVVLVCCLEYGLGLSGSCCCETGNEVSVSLRKLLKKKRTYQSLYMDQSTKIESSGIIFFFPRFPAHQTLGIY